MKLPGLLLLQAIIDVSLPWSYGSDVCGLRQKDEWGEILPVRILCKVFYGKTDTA